MSCHDALWLSERALATIDLLDQQVFSCQPVHYFRFVAEMRPQSARSMTSAVLYYCIEYYGCLGLCLRRYNTGVL